MMCAHKLAFDVRWQRFVVTSVLRDADQTVDQISNTAIGDPLCAT